MFFLEILQTLVGAQPDLDIRNKKLQAPIEVRWAARDCGVAV